MGNQEKENYGLPENTEPEVTEEAIPVQKKSRIPEIIKKAVSLFIITSIISITGFYAIPTFAAQRTIVDGDSMEANYYDGENVIVNKFLYNIKEPGRFDVITLYPYGRKYDDSFKDFIARYADKYIYGKKIKEEYYIKRIIGLPGENVQIIGEDIYINGEILEEDYGKTEITSEGIARDPVLLGDNEYFVLGDNREISKDSRIFGAVKKEHIGGKVIKIFE